MLILDFDKTLIKENSSRVLENKLREYYSTNYVICKGIKNKYMLTLGNFIIRALSRIILKGQDGVLTFNILVAFKLIPKEEIFNKILLDTSKNLHINTKFENLKNKEIFIISTGIKEIIKNFLDLQNFENYKIVVASEISYINKDTKLKKLDDKIKFLDNIKGNFTYYTDDIMEIEKLKNRKINFTIEELGDIYEIKK